MNLDEVIADMKLYLKDGVVAIPGAIKTWVAALEQQKSAATSPNKLKAEICRYHRREISDRDGIPIVQNFCLCEGKLSAV